MGNKQITHAKTRCPSRGGRSSWWKKIEAITNSLSQKNTSSDKRRDHLTTSDLCSAGDIRREEPHLLQRYDVYLSRIRRNGPYSSSCSWISSPKSNQPAQWSSVDLLCVSNLLLNLRVREKHIVKEASFSVSWSAQERKITDVRWNRFSGLWDRRWLVLATGYQSQVRQCVRMRETREKKRKTMLIRCAGVGVSGCPLHITHTDTFKCVWEIMLVRR